MKHAVAILGLGAAGWEAGAIWFDRWPTFTTLVAEHPVAGLGIAVGVFVAATVHFIATILQRRQRHG